MDDVNFRSVRVALGASATADGYLVFSADRLLGVLVRVDAEDEGGPAPGFHLEADFHGLDRAGRPPAFADLRQAEVWFRR